MEQLHRVAELKADSSAPLSGVLQALSPGQLCFRPPRPDTATLPPSCSPSSPAHLPTSSSPLSSHPNTAPAHSLSFLCRLPSESSWAQNHCVPIGTSDLFPLCTQAEADAAATAAHPSLDPFALPMPAAAKGMMEGLPKTQSLHSLHAILVSAALAGLPVPLKPPTAMGKAISPKIDPPPTSLHLAYPLLAYLPVAGPFSPSQAFLFLALSFLSLLPVHVPLPWTLLPPPCPPPCFPCPISGVFTPCPPFPLVCFACSAHMDLPAPLHAGGNFEGILWVCGPDKYELGSGLLDKWPPVDSGPDAVVTRWHGKVVGGKPSLPLPCSPRTLA